MLRHLRTTGLLLLGSTVSFASLGCEGAAPWSDEEETPAAAPQADFGPTAAYDRRLIFLGAGDRLPTAAVLDFQALSDSVGVRRGVRARVVDGQEWIALLDSAWEMEPMREPWRLVPHGPLRLRVDDAGEMAAVELREEPPLRLEPGAIIAEYAPDAGTQLVLREGALVLRGQPRPGLLLDAQLGRSVGPGFLARTTRTDTGPAAAGSTAPSGRTASSDGGRDAAADSLALPVSPTARPGTEALLVDTAGYALVLASTGSGRIAWIHVAGQDAVRRGVRLEATATERFAEAATEVATAWRLLSDTGEIMGELETEAADRTALAAPAGVTALGYVLVSGWVEDRRVRREVFGLVRDIH